MKVKHSLVQTVQKKQNKILKKKKNNKIKQVQHQQNRSKMKLVCENAFRICCENYAD